MHASTRFKIAGWLLVALALTGCSTQTSQSQPPKPAPDAAALALISPFARLTYATAWAKEQRPGFAEFKHWTQRYAQADAKMRPALVAEGVALAKTRRTLLGSLIKSAPSDALAATVPAAVRAQLPAEVQAQLETRVSGRGNFLPVALELPPGKGLADRRVHVDLNGKDYEAFVSARRQGQPGKFNISLHGIVLDGQLALHDSPLRVPEPGELPPAVKVAGSNKAVSVKPAGRDGETSADDGLRYVLAEYAGEILAFPRPSGVGRFEQALIRAERLLGPFTRPVVIPPGGFPDFGDIFADFGDPGWTTGHKNILVIRVDYSDAPGEPHPLAEVERLITTYGEPFFRDMSYGATTLTTTVTPQVYRMPNPAAFYRTGIPAPVGDEPAWVLHADARALAAADYRLEDYDRIGVLSTSISVYAGLAQIGTPRFYMSPIGGRFIANMFTHELGHTYGLDHSNLWQVTDGNPESHGGTTGLYGDPFDDMAVDVPGDPLPHYHFNPRAKYTLGWLPESAVTTVRRTGLYPLYHFDEAAADLTRPLALRVFRDGFREYWIGYRHNLASHPALAHGAYIMWGHNFHRAPWSFLLDLATPGVSALDAPMPKGGSLIDPFHNVDIGNFPGTPTDEYLEMKIAVSTSPGYIAFWGYGSTGIASAPDITGGVTDIAANHAHALAVKTDGTVVAWGFPNTHGEATVPAGLRNVSAVAAGSQHSLALDRIGTVSGWGDNSSGQLDVPAGLRNVYRIAAGAFRSVALRTDGTVVQWGLTADTIPMPAGLTEVTAIAPGAFHVLALRRDGTVVAWGNNLFGPGETRGALDVPAGLSNVIAIAAGYNHSLALRRDGTVVAWGSNTYGQSEVPAGLTNVVTLGAGHYHSLARKSDGTLVAWGENSSGGCDVPAGAPHIVKLAGGAGYSLALVGP